MRLASKKLKPASERAANDAVRKAFPSRAALRGYGPPPPTPPPTPGMEIGGGVGRSGLRDEGERRAENTVVVVVIVDEPLPLSFFTVAWVVVMGMGDGCGQGSVRTVRAAACLVERTDRGCATASGEGRKDAGFPTTWRNAGDEKIDKRCRGLDREGGSSG